MGAPVIFRADMPAMNYLDLAASWDVNKHLQLRGGINNVFDKDPPLAPFRDRLGRRAQLLRVLRRTGPTAVPGDDREVLIANADLAGTPGQLVGSAGSVR